MIKTSHKRTDEIQTKWFLELLHMDLMGPFQVQSYGGKKYVLVCVDDFSRFTWVKFMRHKSEAVEQVTLLILRLQRESDATLNVFQSNHNREFKNKVMDLFCQRHAIEHQYSNIITLQQYGVAE